MTDLEQLIRETLRARADEAPRATGLRSDVASLHRTRSRLRSTGIAAAATALVVIAIVVPLVLLSNHDNGAPPVARQTTTPGPPVPGRPWQTFAYHGIEFDVPASWSVNVQRCGTPTEDTVLRDLGGVETCLIPRPPHVDSVELLDNPSSWVAAYPGTFTTTSSDFGTTLRVGTEHGRTTFVLVPQVHVAMKVAVRPESLAREIVRSIHVVRTDQYGCAMRTTQLYAPPAKVPPGYKGKLALAPDATSAAICKYTGDWLTASTVIDGKALDALRAAIASAPSGFNHTDPNDYLASICRDDPTEHGAGYIVHVHTATGPSPGTTGDPQTLWAHVQTCGPLGISDGLASRALTPALASALNSPLHTGYTYAMHLLPGPP